MGAGARLPVERGDGVAGTTALGGHLDVVKWLITTGADVNYIRPLYGTTAVYVAAQNGLLDVVGWLISAGQGLTLIHFSAQPAPFLTLNTSPKPLKTPSTPTLTLPKHPLNTPCPTKSAYVEMTGGRV